jgi:hypothetical protein
MIDGRLNTQKHHLGIVMLDFCASKACSLQIFMVDKAQAGQVSVKGSLHFLKSLAVIK